MTSLLLALLCFGASVLGFVYAWRCKKDRSICPARFISAFGAPRSIFALQFFGKPEEARKALLEDDKLYRKYVIEQYIISLAIAIAGLLILFARL
jgi:hypothetical protein